MNIPNEWSGGMVLIEPGTSRVKVLPTVLWLPRPYIFHAGDPDALDALNSTLHEMCQPAQPDFCATTVMTVAGLQCYAFQHKNRVDIFQNKDCVLQHDHGWWRAIGPTILLNEGRFQDVVQMFTDDNICRLLEELPQRISWLTADPPENYMYFFVELVAGERAERVGAVVTFWPATSGRKPKDELYLEIPAEKLGITDKVIRTLLFAEQTTSTTHWQRVLAKRAKQVLASHTGVPEHQLIELPFTMNGDLTHS